MLVLSRKVGEVIVIDGGVTVTVLEMKGQRVRLGIGAPESVSILRQELCFDRANGAGVSEQTNDPCDDPTDSCERKSHG